MYMCHSDEIFGILDLNNVIYYYYGAYGYAYDITFFQATDKDMQIMCKMLDIQFNPNILIIKI